MTETAAVRADPWRLARTADAYHKYTIDYPLYDVTSRELAEAAGTSAGMRVADLGCGTGVTTEAIARRVGPAGRVLALDSSPAMLARARARLPAANVTWHEGPAERADELIAGRVDQVLCNMAFWQFDLGRVLAAVARLTDGGPLAFSLGYRRPPGSDPDVAALAAGWRQRLRQHGYDVVGCSQSAHEESADALAAWLKLPLGRSASGAAAGGSGLMHAVYLVCRYRPGARRA